MSFKKIKKLFSEKESELNEVREKLKKKRLEKNKSDREYLRGEMKNSPFFKKWAREEKANGVESLRNLAKRMK